MTTDANKGPEILGIFITLSTIATILVALRLWVRLWLIRKTGLDDWVVLVSLVCIVEKEEHPWKFQAKINQS